MAKKIITIHYDIPGLSDNYHNYTSDQSLLDADIIVFEPSFVGYNYYNQYQGKPSYDEDTSFRIKEDTSHWKKELSSALESGKTVFIFFGRYEEIFVRTGEVDYQGTGRNARKINQVTSYHNYKFFPIDLPSIIPKSGTELKFIHDKIFANFSNEFKDHIKYESYLDDKIDSPIYITKTGEKPAGGLFKIGTGHLVLLPPPRYDEKKFTRKNKKGEGVWTEEAMIFGNKLTTAIVEIDKALRGGAEATPKPDWLTNKEFNNKVEISLKKKIESVTTRVDGLTTAKNGLLQELENEVRLKDLLYENSKPLENAILEALHILGFKAEGYDDGTLELDSVILSPESTRYIGEAEGKDSSAINIDKFRQLESNIQEDLEKDEIDEPASGILFGNGYRLTIPSDRAIQFTEKCVKNAKRLGVALITTSDLYRVASTLRENGDKKYAKECRKVIMAQKGKIVDFPKYSVTKNVTK